MKDMETRKQNKNNPQQTLLLNPQEKKTCKSIKQIQKSKRTENGAGKGNLIPYQSGPILPALYRLV